MFMQSIYQYRLTNNGDLGYSFHCFLFIKVGLMFLMEYIFEVAPSYVEVAYFTDSIGTSMDDSDFFFFLWGKTFVDKLT